MIKIGYINDTYPNTRCIINKIDNNEVKYIHICNNDKVNKMYQILKKLKLKNTNPRENFFKSQNINIDLIHTFNFVCNTKKPWIATFETVLPRTKEILHYHHEISEYKITQNVKKYINLIASSNCKKIIALSECNKKIQEEFLKNFDTDLEKKVKEKMVVIHPPQKLLLTEGEIEEKLNKIKNELHFLFIGNDFFRKGGSQLIEVLSNIRKKKLYQVKLTIISKINTDLEISNTNGEDKKRILKFFEENKEWIEWYSDINNEEVLRIAKKCDIGLLPTIQDTYGYSVLEMQAAGLPVITTNIRALPEINNDECGWICSIPKNHFGEALYSNNTSRENTMKVLEEQLEKIILEILKNPSQIKEKGYKAYQRIKKEHNPEKYGERLYELYIEAIGGKIIN